MEIAAFVVTVFIYGFLILRTAEMIIEALEEQSDSDNSEF